MVGRPGLTRLLWCKKGSKQPGHHGPIHPMLWHLSSWGACSTQGWPLGGCSWLGGQEEQGKHFSTGGRHHTPLSSASKPTPALSSSSLKSTESLTDSALAITQQKHNFWARLLCITWIALLAPLTSAGQTHLFISRGPRPHCLRARCGNPDYDRLRIRPPGTVVTSSTSK